MIKNNYNDGISLTQKLTFINHEESNWHKLFSKRNDAFKNVLKRFNDATVSDKDTINYAGSALLFLNEGVGDVPGAFYGIRFSPDKCELLSASESAIKQFHLKEKLELQKKIIELPTNQNIAHAVRRASLDMAIKTLRLIEQELSDDVLKSELANTLARAYLYRSRIIRQKGFSVPAKKIEGFNNAIDSLKKIKSPDLEYFRLKAIILLELEKTKQAFHPAMEATLREWFSKLPNDALSLEDHLLLLKHAEFCLDDTVKQKLKALYQNPKASSFHKLQAAVLLNDAKGITDQSTSVINDLKQIPFSHDTWLELVNFLKKRKNFSAWETLVTDAWETACKKEALTTHNCHLRWYWSQQQDLYDLAFFAYHTVGKKAEVADSLKGRPVLHRQVVEEMAHKNKDISLEAFIEQDNAGLMGQHVRINLPKVKITQSQAPKLKNPPKNWIAVHFYISTGAHDPEKRNHGYALIHDARTGEWREEKDSFDLNPVLQDFWTWQENYALLPENRKHDSASNLVKLCYKLGETMGFLFELPEGQPVVFIPHGFLHRIPLHMAMKKNEGSNGPSIWAENRLFSYLPAWSLWKVPQLSTNAKMLIQHFEYDYRNILNLFSPDDIIKNPASSSDWCGQTAASSLLFLLCHGKAHAANPFSSGLILKDGKFTCEQILSGKVAVNGSRIFLGACETDLVPPQGMTVDEHPSISCALYEKGASEILSGLYQINSGKIESLGVDVLNNASDSLFQRMKHWLTDRIADYLASPNNQGFYEIAAFRTIGLPVKDDPPSNQA